jgi:zinc D-Ala-D-Ala carboxypeptidase
MHRTTSTRAGAGHAASLGPAGLALILTAVIGSFGFQAASSSTSFGEARRGEHAGGTTEPFGPVPGVPGASPEDPGARTQGAGAGTEDPRAGTEDPRVSPEDPVARAAVPGAVPKDDGVVTEEDGELPDDVTVFDVEYPGVANLDPDLLRALREAATDAAGDDIGLLVNSGWRSPEYQDQLHREAVTEYGSEAEAARRVATANTSAHVSGDAVDIGPFDAAAWLSRYGGRYGLCQIYRNEPWHYELRPEAIGGRCPRMYVDPTDDPRMQQ